MVVKDKVEGPEDFPLDMKKLRFALVDKKIGAFIGAPPPEITGAKMWQRIMNAMHDVALNETRSKIPIIYGVDSIHGATWVQDAILYPQPISMASSFNVDIAKAFGEITAKEQRAAGFQWNFR